MQKILHAHHVFILRATKLLPKLLSIFSQTLLPYLIKGPEVNFTIVSAASRRRVSDILLLLIIGK
jgi:hypothetical protein